MNRIFSLFLATGVLTACHDSGGSPGEKNDTSIVEKVMPVIGQTLQNEQTALLAIQAVNSHDPKAMLRDWDSSAVDYGDGSGPPVHGIDSINFLFSAWVRAFPDVRADSLRTLTDNGEHVIVTGDWTGTFKNDIMGIRATGKSFKYWGGDFFTFNDKGKIIEHRSIQSHITLMSQIGVKSF